MLKLAVATDRDGALIFFSLYDTGLEIWLPGTLPGQWAQYFFPPGTDPRARVTGFDMTSNCGQGRCDDSIDLLLQGAITCVTGTELAVYVPALPFATDLASWPTCFSQCIDLGIKWRMWTMRESAS